MTEIPGTQAHHPEARVPQTTVVIPVWDDYVSERLEQALQSVRAQQTPPPPIVVVDNASRVSLPPLPGAWVVRTPTRLTLGKARNLGLTRVDTPYVVFWDADDVMLEGTLPFLEAAIASNPSFVAFALGIVEEASGIRHRWPRPWISRVVGAPRTFALLHAIWSLYPSTGSTIMRTEAVRAAGGYSDADSGDDWCLGVSLAFRGPLGWSERPGRLYHVHAGSITAERMAPPDLIRHARVVRERIRTDPGVPAWARRSLPLIRLGQRAAIGAHVALEWARKLRARQPGDRVR